MCFIVTMREKSVRLSCLFLVRLLDLCRKRTVIQFGTNCSILRKNTKIFKVNGA